MLAAEPPVIALSQIMQFLTVEGLSFNERPLPPGDPNVLPSNVQFTISVAFDIYNAADSLLANRQFSTTLSADPMYTAPASPPPEPVPKNAQPWRATFPDLKEFEYWACGLSVVAPRLPGLEEVIEDRVTGLFYRPDDPGDMAEKITALIENKELSRRLAEMGERLVYEKYRWDRLADEIVGLCESYVEGKP